MATQKDIDNWFIYHKPCGTQPQRYQELRERFHFLATIILENTPACPDQTVALRKLRECSMAVNQTIACNESDEPSEAEVSGSHS